MGEKQVKNQQEILATFFENAAKGLISSSYIFLYLDSTSELKPLSKSSANWKQWNFHVNINLKGIIYIKYTAIKHLLWSSGDYFLRIVILNIANFSIEFDIICFCFLKFRCQQSNLLLQLSYFLSFFFKCLATQIKQGIKHENGLTAIIS